MSHCDLKNTSHQFTPCHQMAHIRKTRHGDEKEAYGCHCTLVTSTGVEMAYVSELTQCDTLVSLKQSFFVQI